MAGEITREAVAAAARKCFLQYDPQRTSMADIADAAGISRQSIYRVFATRAELIEHIILQSFENMSARMAPAFKKYKTFREALVEGSVLALKVADEDKLYRELIEKCTDHNIEHFIFKSSEPIQSLMLGVWTPLINQARADDEIDPDLSDIQVVAWIQQFQALLTMLPEHDPVNFRYLLHTFLIPSICGWRSR